MRWDGMKSTTPEWGIIWKSSRTGLMDEIRAQSSFGGFGFLESLGGMFADEYRARKGDHPLVRVFFRLVRERRRELTREWR